MFDIEGTGHVGHPHTSLLAYCFDNLADVLYEIV